MNNLITESDIENLWKFMTRMYGAQWAQFGDMDDGTWLMGLGDLTKQQLQEGIKKASRSKSSFPPNLPTFRNLCLPVDQDALEAFVKKEALKGYDSFDQRRMTYKQIDAAIARVRESATQKYMDSLSSDPDKVLPAGTSASEWDEKAKWKRMKEMKRLGL